MTPDHTERSTLAACIAHVAGASASDVPLDPSEQGAWLAERGLGLVPVADAAVFSWAGPWIARRPARDGSGPRAVVSFDVQGGPERADAVCRSVRIIRHATSLGGVESTIERRAAIPGQTHLPPGLLRLSVGCEHPDDLWRDLEQALTP